MSSENVVAFTDDNFEQEIINSDVPVLADFWAEWCGPCKMLSPTIDALADEYAGKVKIGKVDTDSNRNLSMQFQIQSIPTIVIFKGGQVVKKFIGLQQKMDLADALDEILAE